MKAQAAESNEKKPTVSTHTRESSAAPGPVSIENTITGDDVKMTNGNHAEQQGPIPEPVSYSYQVAVVHTSQLCQSPWIPQFEAMFEDCKSMAPSVALDALGFAYSFLSFSTILTISSQARFLSELLANVQL